MASGLEDSAARALVGAQGGGVLHPGATALCFSAKTLWGGTVQGLLRAAPASGTAGFLLKATLEAQLDPAAASGHTCSARAVRGCPIRPRLQSCWSHLPLALRGPAGLRYTV